MQEWVEIVKRPDSVASESAPDPHDDHEKRHRRKADVAQRRVADPALVVLAGIDMAMARQAEEDSDRRQSEQSAE